MNNLHKVAAAVSTAFFIVSAHAQSMGDISNHAVAVGKGPNIQGVTSVAPGTAGFPLISNGASSDPSFQFVPATGGGTGQTSFAIGDLLQASSSTALARLAAVATGNVLISGGVGVVSSWGKVGLTTHVSGILPLANGGVNADLSATGGASQFLRQNSSGAAITVVRPACADLSNSTSYCSAAVGQLPGTSTNDNASSGNIGESFTDTLAVGSAISLSTGTAANILSRSLTAGDWEAKCGLVFVGTGTTNSTQLASGLTTTSATLPTTDGLTSNQWSNSAGQVLGSFNYSIPPVLQRFSLSSTTTVFCVALASFTVSTQKAFGTMQIRRAR